MKKMFIVNGEEFKVGNIYSKADSRKFKEVDDFNDAIWQLTSKKNTIVVADELIDGKKVDYKLEEELDYKKIFNSEDIAPVRKLQYFNKIKEVNHTKYSALFDEAISFFDNCKDLDLSLSGLSTFKNFFDLKLYIKHLENIIGTDSTGKYLKEISSLHYSVEHYSKDIVDKIFKLARESHDLDNLMSFISNLSERKEYSFSSEIDFYEVLNLIDEYDKTGKYYTQLNRVLPYFELNHIQTRIIELAKANKNCTYCIRFLDNIILYHTGFHLYKTIRLNDLINIMIDYWDENHSKYFIIQDNILKYLSKENIIKLLNKCDDRDKKEINSFLIKNNINI